MSRWLLTAGVGLFAVLVGAGADGYQQVRTRYLVMACGGDPDSGHRHILSLLPAFWPLAPNLLTRLLSISSAVVQ